MNALAVRRCAASRLKFWILDRASAGLSIMTVVIGILDLIQNHNGGVFTRTAKREHTHAAFDRNQLETELSTHSKMVETRRKREKNKKRTARVAKHEEKLKKQGIKGGGAEAAKKANP